MEENSKFCNPPPDHKHERLMNVKDLNLI